MLLKVLKASAAVDCISPAALNISSTVISVGPLRKAVLFGKSNTLGLILVFLIIRIEQVCSVREALFRGFQSSQGRSQVVDKFLKSSFRNLKMNRPQVALFVPPKKDRVNPYQIMRDVTLLILNPIHLA